MLGPGRGGNGTCGPRGGAWRARGWCEGAGPGPLTRRDREGSGRELWARRCPDGGGGGRTRGPASVPAAPRPRPPARRAMPPPAPPTELVPSERAVVLLSCALSALGSGLLVATHALWPDLRSRARRLLLFLSLADLLSAASYFYGVLQDFAGPSWDCVLQGALSTFANTSSFFWTVAIALYLYLSIVRSAREPRTGRLLWAFHVVRWVTTAPLRSSSRPPRLGPACCLWGPRALVAPASRSDPWRGARQIVSAHVRGQPRGQRDDAGGEVGPVLSVSAEGAPSCLPWPEPPSELGASAQPLGGRGWGWGQSSALVTWKTPYAFPKFWPSLLPLGKSASFPGREMS